MDLPKSIRRGFNMAWNGWGEGLTTDFTKAPWTGGVMTLTHEEVLHVQTETAKIIEAYVPKYGEPLTPPDNEYVVPRYNELDWEKCINGDTYAVIKGYDPLVHQFGIDSNGIILPESTPITEETSQPVEENTGEPVVEDVVEVGEE
jgi:hypothetical protein